MLQKKKKKNTMLDVCRVQISHWNTHRKAAMCVCVYDLGTEISIMRDAHAVHILFKSIGFGGVKPYHNSFYRE